MTFRFSSFKVNVTAYEVVLFGKVIRSMSHVSYKTLVCHEPYDNPLEGFPTERNGCNNRRIYQY